jgi:hypothetical protein
MSRLFAVTIAFVGHDAAFNKGAERAICSPTCKLTII